MSMLHVIRAGGQVLLLLGHDPRKCLTDKRKRKRKGMTRSGYLSVPLVVGIWRLISSTR